MIQRQVWSHHLLHALPGRRLRPSCLAVPELAPAQNARVLLIIAQGDRHCEVQRALTCDRAVTAAVGASHLGEAADGGRCSSMEIVLLMERIFRSKPVPTMIVYEL